MSASLVGSEMCIRDRCNPTSNRGLGPRSSTGRPLLGVGPRNGSPQGLVPVSYTHLTLPTICSV
eukprot:3262384-Alexandrium_andersonii.AAC.1